VTGGADYETLLRRCVNVLVELIQTKVNYVVQEAIIVIRDIFRKYPNKYEVGSKTGFAFHSPHLALIAMTQALSNASKYNLCC
jgi:hypothetical protein